MSDTLWAAIIALIGGLSGAILTSIIGAIIQWKITKKVCDNTRQTALFQVKSTNRLEFEKQRKEKIVDLIADFVSITDPGINKTIDSKKAVNLINRIQLRLNRKNNLEAKINGHLNNM